MDNLPLLPVLLTEDYPHVITDESQLCRVQYASTITNKEPNYYLDSNGDWFEGKFTKILRRTSLVKRWLWYDDVITVDMTFPKLDQEPMTDQKLKRYLLEASSTVTFRDNTGFPRGSKEYTKLVRAEFRTCESTAEVIQWLIKYKITMKPWDRWR